MKPFQNEREATEFLSQLLKSDFWDWTLTVLRGRETTIFAELGGQKLTADGRAMLTGRLLEIRYLLNFPSASFQFFRGQQAAVDLANQEEREELIQKTAFPDVITH